MNPRDLALLEIDRRRLPGWPSRLIRPTCQIDKAPAADPRDVALAERLTMGTIKNLLHLQHLLQHHSSKRLRQIDPLVAKIAVIALYQLRFMQRVPASAAVDEAVEQARRFGRARAAGFVNAVLRNATRHPDPPPPDPARDPQAYASQILSHPGDLYRRLTRLLGPCDALRVCRHNNAEPPTLVRLFRGVTKEQLHATAPEVRLQPHEQSGMLVVESGGPRALAGWARSGLAQVQDATAARAVSLLDVRPGQRVLDRCAGYGTKTFQIYDDLCGRGEVVAVDPAAQRLRVLRELAVDRGIDNVAVHQAALLRDLGGIEPQSFDRILMDVPCSNSGVLARRAEARYHQQQPALDSLIRSQRDILADSAPYAVCGGLLVYSTCSLWEEENERQIEWFARSFPNFQPIASARVHPSLDPGEPIRYRDGGFFAVLRRQA
jgi:16S rRNA (cytosine967-C5)-methyltransferase